MTGADTPGLYSLSAETYHADPCAVPSLSTSIAKLLVDRSPRHAWFAHPRLNPAHEREERDIFDLGSVAHSRMLGDPKPLAVIDAPDWRTKDAREARDAARAAGKLPILAANMERVDAMVTAVRAQLAGHAEASDAFTDGRPEQTLIWQERGVWCRARLDWLPAGGRVFDDFKSTSGAAHPDAWGARQFFDTGADLQAAFYRRGIRAVLGISDPVFRFVVAELDPPHALCVMQPGPDVLAIADRKVDVALDLWRHCLRHNRWPGYPSRTCHIELPTYRETAWLLREEREEAIGDREAMFRMLMDWQAPIAPPKEAA